MTKRFSLTLSVLSSVLGSCAQAGKAPQLPLSVSPGWQLSAMRETSPHTAWQGDYSGPGRARVRVYSTLTPSDGMDRVQKWRRQANTVVFASDRYFAVVDWTGVDRVQAGSLVRAMEHAIGIQPQTR